MKISKEQLKQLWYEDENGNEIPNPNEEVRPSGAVYQVSRFPKTLTTNYLRLINQEDVDKCKHPRQYVKPTSGWKDGIVGRECTLCKGTQIKHKGHRWPKKWEGYGSRRAYSFSSTWNDEETILAMANSGDYTLSEAIILYAESCERCMNVLVYKYTNGKDGYSEYGEEWQKCGTSCKFCKDDDLNERNVLETNNKQERK